MVLTKEQETQVERCLQTAYDAGCPRDQAERLVSAGYIPLPWQWEFHAAAREADRDDGPVEITAGGARGPGKSHGIFSQAALDDCQRVDRLKVLFLRKTALSAKESFDDLIEKALLNKARFSRSNNTIIFPNGSRILLGGFNNEDDIDKYVGVEYDLIVVEEMNQLTEEKIEKLKGSLRTSKPNWRPRLYGSFNPGGVGHGYVKARYVIPRRIMSEKRTRFIPATYRVNPYLNKEYIEYLESLPGDLGRAWRDGDFDLFAGQFFKEWRYEVHVVQPFTIPDDWRRFFALDYGFNHPLSIGWYAVDPDGRVFRYKELVQSGLNYTKAAEEFVALTSLNENLEYGVCDPAFWSKKGERDDTLSGAEVFARRVKELTKKEPRLIKADNDRITGWGVVREYLRPYEQHGQGTIANFAVFSTCPKFIETFPEQQHDEKHPEDMLKQDGDDTADEARYALMSRPQPTMSREKKAELEWRAAMKKKNQRQGKPLFIRPS